MTPKLLFWTFALVNMAIAFSSALVGVHFVRKGELERHKRWMRFSGFSILLFVVAYALKVALLGHEDLSAWSAPARAVLRIHECFVFCFLAFGGYAVFISRRAERLGLASPEARLLRGRHARAGRLAVRLFALALLTAAMTYGVMRAQKGAAPVAGQAREAPGYVRLSTR